MPNITTAGTVDRRTPGFEGLGATADTRTFLFAGSSLGTSCFIQYTDDMNVDQTIANGSITALPASALVQVNKDLKIVTTGSPNFNLTINQLNS